jgi:hypothetical protein
MRRAFAVVFAVVSLVGPSAGHAWSANAHPQVGAPSTACSTPLTLYDGANRSGGFVTISARGQWINLSTLLFDNKTSSYKVGACSVSLSASPGGGGNFYPECLIPGCIENAMLPGWNNVFSSVFIN